MLLVTEKNFPNDLVRNVNMPILKHKQKPNRERKQARLYSLLHNSASFSKSNYDIHFSKLRHWYSML